ncbi:MAG TPA: DsbA family protein [Acidimicrobiales bacterium]|nr:DsbA family protein [Acidimicrobiales bacterium]
MTKRSFAVTYDYRCPFARNVHEHVVAGLGAGADWDVVFSPFSLTQAHVEDGALPVWEDQAKASHLLATEAGLAVRDNWPDRFADVHLALFAARHDEARDLRDEAVVRDILRGAGLDDNDVFEAVRGGAPHATFRKEHEAAVAGHKVFGVPTFVMGERAVFVRILTRPNGDGVGARATVDHVLDLMSDHADLNEFKHTTIPR